MLHRALLTSGIVGTILTGINQWKFFIGDADLNLIQAALTYMVPFTVSLATAAVVGRSFKTVIESAETKGEDQKAAILRASESLSQIAGNATKVNSASKARVGALEELSQTSKTIQNLLRKMQHDAGENARRLTEANENVSNIVGSTQRVVSRVEGNVSTSKKLDHAVLELADQSESIEAVANQIRTVSGKTSILAVNASIEASRAGEAGRGFGVVANQVGDLSALTDQAVIAIFDTLEDLRSGFSTAQSSLSTMIETMDLSLSDSTANINVADEVRSELVLSLDLAREVADAMGRQTNLFDEIAEFLEQIQLDTAAAVKGSAKNVELANSALEDLTKVARAC